MRTHMVWISSLDPLRSSPEVEELVGQVSVIASQCGDQQTVVDAHHGCVQIHQRMQPVGDQLFPMCVCPQTQKLPATTWLTPWSTVASVQTLHWLLHYITYTVPVGTKQICVTWLLPIHLQQKNKTEHNIALKLLEITRIAKQRDIQLQINTIQIYRASDEYDAHGNLSPFDMEQAMTISVVACITGGKNQLVCATVDKEHKLHKSFKHINKYASYIDTFSYGGEERRQQWLQKNTEWQETLKNNILMQEPEIGFLQQAGNI